MTEPRPEYETGNADFAGFQLPKQNWSKLPHQIIDLFPQITALSELKVVLYVLRHTWGFQEFGIPKRITLDEFSNGRKLRNGERMDGGTGMSVNAIKDGVQRAIEHGFLVRVSDGRDAGRSSHAYQLRVSEVDTQVSKVDSQPSEVDTRSEKDTIERNYKKPGVEKPADWATLCQATEEARAKEGQWTMPQNGDGLVSVAISCIYELLGSEPPKANSGTWRKLAGKLEPILIEHADKDERSIRGAVRLFYEEEPKMFNPWHNPFPEHLGIYIGKVCNKGQKILKVGH